MLFPFYSYEKMAESRGEWGRCFTHTCLPGANTLAYYEHSWLVAGKSFIALGPAKQGPGLWVVVQGFILKGF